MNNNLNELIKKEGDFLEWLYTTKSGIIYKCRIIRNKNLGHLCGYVILTKDNTLFKKHYDDISVYVHGGLTFSDFYQDEWMIGFDCAHHGDITPGCGYEDLSYMGTYKNMDFVKSECETLAEQVSNYSLSLKRGIKINKLLK
jgi:hypothetical protein